MWMSYTPKSVWCPRNSAPGILGTLALPNALTEDCRVHDFSVFQVHKHAFCFFAETKHELHGLAVNAGC